MADVQAMDPYLEGIMNRINGQGVKIGTDNQIRIAEEEAKRRWNAEADQYNQWDELGQDEKDELISKIHQPGT